MKQTSTTVRRTYYVLTAGNTLAASLIWGINTIFLLDAGLSNFQAFAANAFFTAGMVLFEIPTGIVADRWGRRVSFLCGTVTLAATTGLYVLLWQLRSPFVWWAIVSALLGLGFTFFSGATEAWLVDALTATRFDGQLEGVFARGQVVGGAMMLSGSVAGGYLAQLTNLGVPYVLRAGILLGVFVLALFAMHDLGFTPDRDGSPLTEMKKIVDSSVEHGLKVPADPRNHAVRLLQRWRRNLCVLCPAAIPVATLGKPTCLRHRRPGRGDRRWRPDRRRPAHRANIVGAVPAAYVGIADHHQHQRADVAADRPGRQFLDGRRRDRDLGLAESASRPIRQAYLNGMIPSQQRATILSFDSLIDNAGGIVAQPALGKSADVWGYPASYLFSAAGTALALPFIARARSLKAPADEETAPLPATPQTGSVKEIDT